MEPCICVRAVRHTAHAIAILPRLIVSQGTFWAFWVNVSAPAVTEPLEKKPHCENQQTSKWKEAKPLGKKTPTEASTKTKKPRKHQVNTCPHAPTCNIPAAATDQQRPWSTSDRKCSTMRKTPPTKIPSNTHRESSPHLVRNRHP